MLRTSLSLKTLTASAMTAVLLTFTTAHASLSIDTQARLIGGFMPVGQDASDPEVISLTQSSEWRTASRSASMSSAWAGGRSLFSPTNQRNMRSFFSANLGQASDTKGLLYFFGGPDVLYPLVLFPKLERVVLVGLEQPGRLLDPTDLQTQGLLAQKMGEVGSSFEDILSTSYFITNNMAKDLQEFGTTTLISVGLVAMGMTVSDIEQISLDANGDVLSNDSGSVPGVRISFIKPDGQSAEVLYFRFDLSNGGLRARPQFTRFVQKNEFQTAYYKAASFISHDGGFSSLNQLVLSKVNSIVQNDDGIPFNVLRASGAAWNMRLFGLYTPPHAMFQTNVQNELMSGYQQFVCRQASQADLDVWNTIWGADCPTLQDFGFASLSWIGMVPFRYGYAAVSGPPVVSYAQKTKFSTLMVMDRN